MQTVLLIVAASVLIGLLLVVLALMRRRRSPPESRSAPALAGSPAERNRGPAPVVRDGDEEAGTTLGVDRPLEVHGGVSVTMEIDLQELASAADDEPSGSVPRILVTAVGQTDIGRRRKHNEDAYLVLPSHSVFAIADGMGGYAAGEVASQMAIDVLTRAFETQQFGGRPIPGLPPRGDELVRAVQAANTAILNQARSNEAQAGMGTTLVAARFSPNRKRVYIAHVGDSRAYRLRNGRLKQLTTDHTLAALGIQGPSANKLSRAVGVFDEVEVDLTVDEPECGDYYILCSDGLSKMVPESTIVEIVTTSPNLDTAVTKLIAEANARGGKDNITVILIRVEEPAAA